MQSEIISYLRLSDVSEDKFIFVTKDVPSDINFIYCEILPYYIKNNYCVILLNFAQSFAHYNHLLLKSGVNIRQLRDSEDLVTIDGLAEIEKLTNSNACESEPNAVFSTLFSSSLGIECMKQLYSCVKDHVQKFTGEARQYVLFLDDISILLNLGLDLKAITAFVQYCRSANTDWDDINCNVLLIGCTLDNLDQENVKMTNSLLHLADIRIEVEGLKTGYSKDVHGKIIFSKRNGMEGISHHEKMLFKVSEKGAKLLTLGL